MTYFKKRIEIPRASALLRVGALVFAAVFVQFVVL